MSNKIVKKEINLKSCTLTDICLIELAYTSKFKQKYPSEITNVVAIQARRKALPGIYSKHT